MGVLTRLASLFRRKTTRGGDLSILRLPAPPEGLVAAVVPAHNEEALIENTIRSLLLVFSAKDIYVFCDACTDQTAVIARRMLPTENVIVGERQIGKSRGIEYMLRHCVATRGYKYMSIVDADTTVEPGYLQRILPALERGGVVCVVGQVKAYWHPRNIFSVYRTYIYALWQAIYKRLQSYTNSVMIASGCATTWKVDVLLQLEYDHDLSTEDFDLTIQTHRRRLGRIVYEPSAVVWTQEPFTMKTYRKQMRRWVRAWWEVVRKYQLGIRWFHLRGTKSAGLSVIDLMTVLVNLEVVAFCVLLMSLLLLPLFIVHPVGIHFLVIQLSSRSSVDILLVWQLAVIALPTLVAAVITRRPLMLLYIPVFLALMYVDMAITAAAVWSTTRRLYRSAPSSSQTMPASVWESPERRLEPVAVDTADWQSGVGRSSNSDS